VCHRLRPGGTVQQRRRPGRRGGFPGLDAPVRGPGATALTLTPLDPAAQACVNADIAALVAAEAAEPARPI